MSPLTIMAFVVLALAIKVSVLVALAGEVLRRVERWPVSGAWTLRNGGSDAIGSRGGCPLFGSDAGDGAKMLETVERVGPHLRAETRVVLPAYGLDRARARVYERAGSANRSREEIVR